MTAQIAVGSAGLRDRVADAARRRPSARWIALVLVLGCKPAGATALGGAATSMGVFAALATLFALQAWPEQLPGAVLPLAGAALGAAALAWLWRGGGLRGVGILGIVSGRRGAAALPAVAAATARRAAVVLPPDLERAVLLADVRAQFVRLQAAWDLGETQALSALTTPDMLAELCFDWPGVGPRSGANRTDVMTLDAELLGFDEMAGLQLVSVEFSGLIREAADQGAVPFRELWMLARPKHEASGWRLARQQSLL